MTAYLLVLSIGLNSKIILNWASAGGNFAHFSELHARAAQIEPGYFPRYDGGPISTQYWPEVAKYAKIGLVRAGILPIFRSCRPMRRKASRGTSPDMMACLLVLSIGVVQKYDKVGLVGGGDLANFWSFPSAGEIFPHFRG